MTENVDGVGTDLGDKTHDRDLDFRHLGGDPNEATGSAVVQAPDGLETDEPQLPPDAASYLTEAQMRAMGLLGRPRKRRDPEEEERIRLEGF